MLLDSPSPRAQEKAAGALSAIALDNDANKTFIARMLIDLLSTEDRPAAAKAARAISRVARAHPKNQEALAQAGVIDILVNCCAAPAMRRPRGVKRRRPLVMSTRRSRRWL